MIAAEDITYGAIINGGEVLSRARARAWWSHTLEGGDFAMQTVGAPQLWARLCEAMKRPDLAEDPRFATPLARRRNWPPLRDLIVEWLDGFVTRERRAAGACGPRACRLPPCCRRPRSPRCRTWRRAARFPRCRISRAARCA